MNKHVFSHYRLRHKGLAPLLILLAPVCLALVLTLCRPGRVLAAQVTRVDAGSYTLNVQMSLDAPQVDQPFDILITPQDSKWHLSGQVVETPVSGTDAANVYIPLTSQGNTLRGELHLPVRGFWQLVIELDGPDGRGVATIPVVVSAPGAMPIWLAWTIGALPALGLLWWVLRQRAYRRTLLVQQTRMV